LCWEFDIKEPNPIIDNTKNEFPPGGQTCCPR